MRQVKKILGIGCLTVLLTACGNSETEVNTITKGEDVALNHVTDIVQGLTNELDISDESVFEESVNQEELRSPENANSLNETESKKEDNITTDSEADKAVQEDIIEITEKMYVTYINDIYTNLKNYEGKKIRLEGMFTSTYDQVTNETYYFVYRVGPGCCGNDGSMCGLEFTTTDEIPEENAWIEVTGTLESYEQDGFEYLTLRDSKVVIKEERGQETVYQ